MNKKENKTRPFLCIELLNTFSEEEISALKQFISCTYFNTDDSLKKLLSALDKSVLRKPTFTPELQYEVYRKVFPHLSAPKPELQKKERSLLNIKLNTLMRLSEQFLSVETIKEHPQLKNELLYPQLLKRRQFWSFNRQVKKERKLLNEQANKGEEQFEQLYRTESQVLDYLYRTGQLMVEDNLSELVGNLDFYYVLRRLSLQLTALSLQWASAKKTYEFDLKDIASLLEHPQYAHHPLVELYVKNIQLMERRDDETYTQLLGLLDKHQRAIPTNTFRNFYTTCISYCVHQVRNGYMDYYRKIFDLYLIMHHKNLLIEQGMIHRGMLKNMVIIACREQEFDWAENFIEHYRPFVSESIRESVYQFLLGMLAFYQKDYEKAHDRFIKVDKIDTTYDINTRVIILKCIYEKEKEYHEPIMQSFRTAEKYFISHTLLPAKSKQEYKNFIRTLINLYRIRHGASKMSVERLKEKLEAQKANSDKQWLLLKIEELR